MLTCYRMFIVKSGTETTHFQPFKKLVYISCDIKDEDVQSLH